VLDLLPSSPRQTIFIHAPMVGVHLRSEHGVALQIYAILRNSRFMHLGEHKNTREKTISHALNASLTCKAYR